MVKETEKTYDKPMKGESSKVFKRFMIYRNLSPDVRTIEKTADIILQDEGMKKSDENYESAHKKMVSSLGNSSSKWFWVARSLMYDNDLLIKEQLEHDKEFKEVNRELIDNFKEIIHYCNKQLNDLNNGVVKKSDGGDYSAMTLSKMVSDIAFTLKTSNEQIRLCFGRSTDNKHVNMDANVNTTVSGKVDVDVKLDEMMELADLMENMNYD